MPLTEEGEGVVLAAYWRFYNEVASAQLATWLPKLPGRVLDLSETHRFAAQVAASGHHVIRVVDEVAPETTTGTDATGGAHRGRRDGQVSLVVADRAWPTFLGDESVDAVVAEQLSGCLATESVIEGVVRVMRPGGRLLLRVDSLILGMSRLAEQNCWAELSDVPSAEVVLVPSPDGTITRCFSPEQLDEALTEAGLEVEWIRPRTVLSPSIVESALQADPGALSQLVEAELELEPERTGETAGIHLVACARRPLSCP
ncbi:MAG: methyltransferase type 11 [Streptosporangiales bacterium]|nr:methyltransferase type 11 [Streptosporangiales bacterium]